MSDSEQYEIIGRAHASLKRSRARIAAITIKLNEYGKELSELGDMVRRFTGDPLYENTAMREFKVPKGNNLKMHLSKARHSEVPSLIDELVAEMESAQELQRQIDNA
jgi:hypothetical protein